MQSKFVLNQFPTGQIDIISGVFLTNFMQDLERELQAQYQNQLQSKWNQKMMEVTKKNPLHFRILQPLGSLVNDECNDTI